MRSKHIPLLMSILICITMISVGFSSWVTLNPPTDGSQSGTLDSYPVTDTNEFVPHGEVDMFTFSPISFIDDKGGYSETGTIVARYTVQLDACYARMGITEPPAELTLLVSLWYSNLAIDGVDNLFEDVDNGTNKRVITVSASSTTPGVTATGGRTASNDNSACYAEFKLTGIGKGTCEIEVTYTFNIPRDTQAGVHSNFRHMFGKYIRVTGENKTQFHTTARITEVE